MFVQLVVDEVYGSLWKGRSSMRKAIASRIASEDWSSSWVALSSRALVGIVLTHNDWIEDLWVMQAARGIGIGRALLSRAEHEIAERGLNTCRLRLFKGNLGALAFYRRFGWEVAKEYRHETLKSVQVLELEKTIVAASENS